MWAEVHRDDLDQSIFLYKNGPVKAQPKNLWQYLNIDVHRCSPLSLGELKKIFIIVEWLFLFLRFSIT